jgi:hypothetical protein
MRTSRWLDLVRVANQTSYGSLLTMLLHKRLDASSVDMMEKARCILGYNSKSDGKAEDVMCHLQG